jgi:hypothetical protein
MKLRVRFLAALLALIGLLTFSVEGAWAASCAEMGSADSGMGHAAQAESCSFGAAAVHANGADMPDGESGAPHCPGMPMGAAGACGAALALPTDSSPELAHSVLEAQLSLPADRVHELLLAGAFFRPPIA